MHRRRPAPPRWMCAARRAKLVGVVGRGERKDARAPENRSFAVLGKQIVLMFAEQRGAARPPPNVIRISCGARAGGRTARPAAASVSLANNITLPLERGAGSCMRRLGSGLGSPKTAAPRPARHSAWPEAKTARSTEADLRDSCAARRAKLDGVAGRREQKLAPAARGSEIRRTWKTNRWCSGGESEGGSPAA
jgi:hypothetical protein